MAGGAPGLPAEGKVPQNPLVKLASASFQRWLFGKVATKDSTKPRHEQFAQRDRATSDHDETVAIYNFIVHAGCE